jgi:peroxiredoxin
MDVEKTGNQQYQADHMGKLFEEGFSFSGFERDKLYLSRRGEGFTDISGLSGLDSVTDGRGAAYGDFDNDGDLDIFLTALQGQMHHLFRNNVGNDNAFVRVSVQGTESGTDAYGSVVRMGTSQGVLTRIKSGGAGFVSQSDPRMLFGIGADLTVPWIEVHWPSGAVQRVAETVAAAGVAGAGQSLLFIEGQSEPVVLQEQAVSLPDPSAADDVVFRSLRQQQGDMFPAITLVDTETGKKTDFHSLRQPGRRYLVNMWATWCVPCRLEMPELQKLYPQLRAAGVDLLGVSLDTGDARRRVPRFLERAELTYPNYTTQSSTLEQLFQGEQIYVPLSYVIDDEGRIEAVFSGWSPQSETTIRKLIH